MESEDGQLYRLEIKNRKRILTTSQGKGSHRGGGKEGKTDTESFRWFPVRARWPHQSWVAEPQPTSTEVTQSQLPWQWRWELPRRRARNIWKCSPENHRIGVF